LKKSEEGQTHARTSTSEVRAHILLKRLPRGDYARTHVGRTTVEPVALQRRGLVYEQATREIEGVETRRGVRQDKWTHNSLFAMTVNN
jgi:hypothetical protein